MKFLTNRPYILFILFVFLIAGLFLAFRFNDMSKTNTNQISSFDDCVAAGYPVMESYPESCKTPDGKTFTKQIVGEQEVTIKGEIICLPHQDQSGPQTMECAYGLKAQNGVFYLKDSDPSYKNISSVPMNEPVQVTGILKVETGEIYQSVGVIEVTTITKL